MSVTLDTDVYVSALEFGGIESRLIGLARAGVIRIDLSEAILDESECVITSDKHLLRIVQFSGMRILRPAEFLKAQD